MVQIRENPSVAPRQPLYLAHCKGFESPLSIKIKATPKVLLLLGALQGIRTPDLLVRSQTLYPAELAAHFLVLIYYSTEFSKIKCFFKKVQIFYFL